ncbi:MAG: hypothetical protein J6Q51_02365 [Clostridia bacterium]|nr:hypothetical protein [Clostridia bacterium]
MATKFEAKQKKLQDQLSKIQEVAERTPIKYTKFSDLIADYDIPPYGFSLITFLHLGPETYEMLTEEPANGRVRGKVEKGLNKAFAGISCGVMTAFTVPIVAMLETPFALPVLGITGAQSLIYTRYNKNIEKAKEKATQLQKELDQVTAQISQEKQSGMEL